MEREKSLNGGNHEEVILIAKSEHFNNVMNNAVVHREKRERMMLNTSLYDGNDRDGKLYWGGGGKT